MVVRSSLSCCLWHFHQTSFSDEIKVVTGEKQFFKSFKLCIHWYECRQVSVVITWEYVVYVFFIHILTIFFISHLEEKHHWCPTLCQWRARSPPPHRYTSRWWRRTSHQRESCPPWKMLPPPDRPHPPPSPPPRWANVWNWTPYSHHLLTIVSPWAHSPTGQKPRWGRQ